jgi:hypothetical protein
MANILPEKPSTPQPTHYKAGIPIFVGKDPVLGTIYFHRTRKSAGKLSFEAASDL